MAHHTVTPPGLSHNAKQFVGSPMALIRAPTYACGKPWWTQQLQHRRHIMDSSGSVCQPPDSLLYVGADLDVYALTLMQPWERTAIFVDHLLGDETMMKMLVKYEARHRNDPRLAWRQSSLRLRPCTQSWCAANLTSQLVQRMVDMPDLFTRVRALGNLSIAFELNNQLGIARELKYVIGRSQARHIKRGMRGQISTVVALAALGNLKAAHFLWWQPACSQDKIAVYTTQHEAAEFFSKFKMRVVCESEEELLAPYPSRDTFSGRRLSRRHNTDTFAYCIQSNRSASSMSGDDHDPDYDDDDDDHDDGVVLHDDHHHHHHHHHHHESSGARGDAHGRALSLAHHQQGHTSAKARETQDSGQLASPGLTKQESDAGSKSYTDDDRVGKYPSCEATSPTGSK